MKKVFDQTVRDLKREMNKKVLKVPGIEQKVLDATSNEPWGPHGSKMADIADATRNFHEYQMIMGVLWKRANDTGKNWRHVYKALTVLEYLVGHGSERVIDELREHAYQIQTLSDFQYVDSGGKDQGVNVRRKAQAIVALINDKERIREVRQKAAANRDKYRGGSSTGGIYKPSTYSSTGGGYGADQYDEDRYGNRYGGRDDDRNGYGRDREFEKYKDDDRYGRNSDSSSRDGDRYGRDRDGGDRDHEDERYNARRNDRSYDKEKDRAYEDYNRNGGRVDEYAPDDRYERKQSGGKWGAPPSYEESVNDSVHQHSDERDGGSLAATVANATTRLANKSQVQDAPVFVENATNSANKGTDDFSDFNPRTSFTAAAPVSSSQTDVDFFGAPSEPLALPSTATVLPASTSASETNLAADLFGDASFGPSFTASAPAPAPAPSSENQPGENPFGDPPFKVSSSSFEDPFSAQTQNTIVPATPSFSAGESGGSGTFTAAAAPQVDTTGSFGFMDSFQAGPSNPFGSIEQLAQSSNNTSIFQTQAQIQVPTQPQIQSQPQIQLPTQPQTQSQAPIQMQPHAHTHTQPFGLDFTQGQAISSVAFTKPQEQTTLQASQVQNAFATSNGKSQQKKEKFEPKSAIWADTLSRGLVDLNISGPKINPLADIGIDLDSISRLEKRRGEKERTSTGSMPSSSQPMGRAMGSGTGLGRAGAGALSTPAAPMVGSMGMGGYGMAMGASSGMGMGAGPNMGMGGMGMGSGAGMGMGPGAGMGMGMGMGMSMPMGPGMGMNPAMTMPGMGMRPPMGMPPGSGVGGVNPMMGAYGSQQQPYGGYR